MKSEVRNFFPKVWETRLGFRAHCPACGDTKGTTFRWMDDRNWGCCFHASCVWYFRKGGITEDRLRKFFKQAPVYSPEVIPAAEGSPDLPEEFGPLLPDVLGYLEGRGLSQKILDEYHVGYCPSGRFWGYIVFPVFDGLGELVYWQGRRYKKREPKFYNPEASLKDEIFFQVGPPDAAHIIVVESIINALTLASSLPATVTILVLLGKNMTEGQRDRLLLWKGLQSVTFVLDPDAMREAILTASLLAGKFRIRLALLPEGSDVNDLGAEKSWQIIKKARIYKEEEKISLLASA